MNDEIIGWWEIRDKKTGKVLIEDQEVTDFRGEKAVFRGGCPPRHVNSTGRIYVSDLDSPDGPTSEYFPSVFGAEWIYQEDMK